MLREDDYDINETVRVEGFGKGYPVTKMLEVKHIVMHVMGGKTVMLTRGSVADLFKNNRSIITITNAKLIKQGGIGIEIIQHNKVSSLYKVYR